MQISDFHNLEAPTFPNNKFMFIFQGIWSIKYLQSWINTVIKPQKETLQQQKTAIHY